MTENRKIESKIVGLLRESKDIFEIDSRESLYKILDADKLYKKLGNDSLRIGKVISSFYEGFYKEFFGGEQVAVI